MKLIVGLGNPGKKYELTRHNLGFLAVEAVARAATESADFSTNSKLESELVTIQVENQKIMLAKPQAFMNLSGRAVQKILAYYDMQPSDLLVVHDDLDLPLGKMRFSRQSGAAGHNGVQSIIDSLGSQNFDRLRLGIACQAVLDRTSPIPVSDFVLQKFADNEQALINNWLPDIVKAIQAYLSQGWEKAASEFNASQPSA